MPLTNTDAPAAKKKRHILVVDDEASICEFLSWGFEDAGFTADVAHNGREALDLAHAHAPDAVVLDLFMPVMDGITFLKYFRSEKEYEKIPVIVVTGCHKESEMRDLPINSFFQKPVMFEMLLREVDQELGKNGNGLNN